MKNLCQKDGKCGAANVFHSQQCKFRQLTNPFGECIVRKYTGMCQSKQALKDANTTKIQVFTVGCDVQEFNGKGVTLITHDKAEAIDMLNTMLKQHDEETTDNNYYIKIEYEEVERYVNSNHENMSKDQRMQLLGEHGLLKGLELTIWEAKRIQEVSDQRR